MALTFTACTVDIDESASLPHAGRGRVAARKTGHMP